MIKVSDFIARHLKERYKVSHVFLISGGGSMHLNDSFGKYLSYSTAHNEQALGIMAEGYARYNHRLALVNVTTGPGGLNAVSALLGQWTDSVPVLYISGQVKFSTTLYSCLDLSLRQLGDQEVDIISIVSPVTKYAFMVTDPLSIKYHLDKAIYEATVGRKGPVWLDIPLDIQSSMIDETQLKNFEIPLDPVYEDYSDEILRLIENAERPLIIAGQGLRLSNQLENFRTFLKKVDIPVLTTFCGMDQLEYTHPNFVGRIGICGQRAGNFALQNADLVLCLGTRNSIFSVSYNYENFAKNAYKIVVDIDRAELDKPTVQPDLKVHTNLANLIPDLLKKSSSISKVDWLNWCLQRKKKYSFANTAEYQQIKKPINPYNFVYHLFASTDKTIVTANASACVISYQVGENKKNQRIFWNKGSAAMGYALPAAVGVYWNSRDSLICLEGDGSIMMNLQELQTIKHYNIPVKIFILNNKSYVSIVQTQNNFFSGHMVHATEQSGFSTPDFFEIAKAFGIGASKILESKDLSLQIQDILSLEGPVLCDVRVDDQYIFSPKLSARKLDDGTMISPSLEDMFPFLNKDEYDSNMI